MVDIHRATWFCCRGSSSRVVMHLYNKVVGNFIIWEKTSYSPDQQDDSSKPTLVHPNLSCRYSFGYSSPCISCNQQFLSFPFWVTTKSLATSSSKNIHILDWINMVVPAHQVGWMNISFEKNQVPDAAKMIESAHQLWFEVFNNIN